MQAGSTPEGAGNGSRSGLDPQQVRTAVAPLATRAALGEPHYLPGAVFLPVVTVLDVRGGGQ